MKNLRGIVFGIIIFLVIIGGILFWRANEKVSDSSDIEAVARYRQDELMLFSESDLNNLRGKVITVTGIVMSNEQEENAATVTLGMNTMELIICQIDNRHLAATSKLTKGHFVTMKGVVSGHDFDELMGKTIQLKNCVLSK